MICCRADRGVSNKVKNKRRLLMERADKMMRCQRYQEKQEGTLIGIEGEKSEGEKSKGKRTEGEKSEGEKSEGEKSVHISDGYEVEKHMPPPFILPAGAQISKHLKHDTLREFEQGHYRKSSEHLDQGSLRKPKIFTCLSKQHRLDLQHILEHVGTQFFLTLLVIADGALVIFMLASTNVSLQKHIEIFSQVILIILFFETLLRFVYKDIYFFKELWCLFDLVVLGALVIFEYAANGSSKDLGKIIVILRQGRFVRVAINFCRAQSRVKKSAKNTVAGTRRRYQKDGFDLDITYITPHLIAMSVPATGGESIYRNPVDEVARFFQKKYKGRFRIYNLVPEREYPYDKFDNQVFEFFMEDHNPAPLAQIIEFCHHIHGWLDTKTRQGHIAAVHCKGGKGRTGTMVCSYLLYSRYEAPVDGKSTDDTCSIRTAEDSLTYFAHRRTREGVVGSREGVEARSQTRFIGYMAKLIKEHLRQNKPISELKPPEGPKIKITKIRILGIKAINKALGIPTYVIQDGSVQWPTTVYKGSTKDFIKSPEAHNDSGEFILAVPIVVKDDIKIAFHVDNKKDLLFGFWWHTFFEKGTAIKRIHPETGAISTCTALEFHYQTIDGIRWAIKKQEYKRLFPDYFKAEIYFTTLE